MNGIPGMTSGDQGSSFSWNYEHQLVALQFLRAGARSSQSARLNLIPPWYIN